MKSKIGFLIALTVILSSIVYFYSRSKSATLPDPILINFEKQKVASFSDFWSIYDKDGSEVSLRQIKATGSDHPGRSRMLIKRTTAA